MALLRYFDHNRLLQVENVFTAKQVDALGAARELVIKKRVVTGPPAYLRRDVEVAGNPQFRTHSLQFRFLNCTMLQAQADLIQCARVLADTVVGVRGTFQLLFDIAGWLNLKAARRST
jgi:hypothetical protein